MIFISGVFYDADRAPPVPARHRADLPLKHLIDGLSAAMVKGTPMSDNLGHLAVVAAWAVFGIFFAIRGFSWEQKRS